MEGGSNEGTARTAGTTAWDAVTTRQLVTALSARLHGCTAARQWLLGGSSKGMEPEPEPEPEHRSTGAPENGEP